jgi:hypothetical protein
MSNSYGFDFLRTEHVDKKPPADDEDDEDEDDDDEPIRKIGSQPSASDLLADNERPKSDLEKQFVVLQFLQENRASGRMFTPSQIYEAAGIDLAVDGEDENCAAMLARNPKVRVEEELNPDYNEEVDDDNKKTLLTYGYQAKFHMSEKTGLLAQINRCKNGIRATELYDAYEGVVEDINALVTGGDVVAVANPEDKDRTLFPRGEPFLVELEGNVTLPDVPDVLKDLPSSKKFKSKIKNKSYITINGLLPEYKSTLSEQEKKDLLKEHSHFVETEVDTRQQMRRGEAIWVAGKWFRISSAIRRDLPLIEQPPRAQAPPSVTLHKELSKKNEVDGYVRPFEKSVFPLDNILTSECWANLQKAKELRDTLGTVTTQLKSSMKSSGGARGISRHNQQALSGMTSSAIRRRPTKHLNAAAARRSTGVNSGHGMSSDNSALVATANGGVGNGYGKHGEEVDTKALMEQFRDIQSDPILNSYSQARRHGCTTDIKTMYLQTIEDVPEDELDLYKMMIKHKLLEEHEPIRRPRLSKNSSHDGQGGKPKKRRYYERKNQRITNTHLVGTEMGSILAAAQVAAAQGKDVGNEGA